jgi:hypothetical protein
VAVIGPNFVETVFGSGHQVDRIAGANICGGRKSSSEQLNPVEQTVGDWYEQPDFVFQVIHEEVA